MNRLNYNPDVLSCLANLSNDEVFTPPQLANQMLDMLPQELFQSPDTKFLDPCTKSGVFLREIAKRLIDGLADTIPDLQSRIDHIMHHQLYGIAITRLTSLMSRRSLYCSKDASCKYSLSHFDDADGNIHFDEILHTWQNGKCIYCGASQEVYDRGEDLETHAYEFIHTDNPKELYNNMTFDVIIGNPPYQFETAGDENGAQARPLYHNFVLQSVKLSPKYIVMITPSRWFAGGWGLDDYRAYMMNCNKIREIHDFPISTDCFNGVMIKGGVSYFKWDRDKEGMCRFVSHHGNEKSETTRYLHEKNCETIIRNNELISIYRKVQNEGFVGFDKLVSGRSPFGFNTNHHGYAQKKNDNDVPYYERSGFTYMPLISITRNVEAIDKFKIYISKAYGAGEGYPHQILNKPIYGDKGTICSGTYLMIGPFETQNITINVISYIQTKFFRALVAINKVSQDASYKVYTCVPQQDFSKSWTDEELYKKYGLNEDEIAFIESMIRPME